MRSDYLDHACGDDPSLRAEVESLLAANDEAGTFGQAPIVAMTSDAGTLSSGAASNRRRLIAGARLGPYRIESWVGAGGMGEVYRALDTKLGRAVAIKVLPDSLAHEPARRSRFEQEARALAALNHPHIGAIYGLEESGDVAALVLEYVDGPTLDQRLARARLSIAEVAQIARQLAEALEAAHDSGIVHRDLKPANIKLTPDGNVKVLDFGLAKAIGSPAPTAVDETQEFLPNAVTATQHGLIVGTPAYMSPEQARGEPVDKRTDIWAFGCVVFEMCARQAPFSGASIAETLGAVIEREPDWEALADNTPPSVARLLRRCLTKDPKLRLRDIGEARIALLGDPVAASEEAAATVSASPRNQSQRRWPWVAVGAAGVLLALVALGSAWIKSRDARPPAASNVRFLVPPPEGNFFVRYPANTFFALSPDGSQIAFVAGREESRIFVRAMSDLEAKPVAGTEGARSVFWSPDSSSLAFLTATTLRRIDLPSGAAVTLSEVSAGSVMHGTWGSRGTILLGTGPGAAIHSVPAAGGELREMVTRDRSKGEARVQWPWFLPDGNRFLYTARLVDGEGELRLGALDHLGDARPILRAASNAQWIEPDTLVFVREGVLMGQRLDLEALQPIGEPFAMAQPVDYFFTTSRGMFSASLNGALAYHWGGDLEQLAWVDSHGKQTGTLGSPADYDSQSFHFSRDGTTLVSARKHAGLGTYDLWRLDLARQTEERLTAERGSEVSPVLIEGGRTVVYAAERGGQPPQLHRRDLLGTGVEQLLHSGLQHIVMDVFPDDRAVAYLERTESGIFDIFQLPLTPGASPSPLVQSRLDKPEMRLSPDGRAMAYVATEGSDWDLHLVSLPVTGPPVVAAAGVKTSGRWSADGRRLYYVGADLRMTVIDVSTAPALSIGMPRTLFALDPSWRFLDVSPDGRFLGMIIAVQGGTQPIVVSTAAPSGAS